MRRNPREFDTGFYWHFSTQSPGGFKKYPGADGLTRRERNAIQFPEVFYDAVLPLSRQAVLAGNAWVYKNRHRLPDDVRNLNLSRLWLTVSSNPEGTLLNWSLFNERGGSQIGGGRARYRDGLWQTTMAKLALQGFGVYPAILGVLKGVVGTLGSSQTLSPGAQKAWQRSGAVFEENRYVIRKNPDPQIRALQRQAEAGDREAAYSLIMHLVRARQHEAIYEAMQYLDEDGQKWAANQYWAARGIHDPHWWHIQVVPYEGYAVWATTSERAEELLREAGVDRAISYGPIWMDPKSLEYFEEDHVIGKTKRRSNPPQRPLRFYHVSLTRDEPRILQEGLIPQTGPRAIELGENEPAICLFGSGEDMHNALMNWLGEELPDDEAITGYQITLPPDFPISPTFEEDDESWEWVTSSPIPPEFIEVVYREPAVD